ncbi:hypothetical protein EZS27_041839, partial [termite gut metagenome]
MINKTMKAFFPLVVIMGTIACQEEDL